MAILIINKFPKYINLAASSVKSILSEFLTWGQSIPARFWGTETPEYWGGLNPQVVYILDAYDSCIDGTPFPSTVYSTSSSFIMGAVIYTDIGLTTPYANQIFGSNINNLPCIPANVGTQTDLSGTIVSTNAEIGGCC